MITVIILLILAAITINLSVGQRGILNLAQEAGRNYQEAAKKEDEDLAKFLGEADNIIAGINTSVSLFVLLVFTCASYPTIPTSYLPI